MRPGQSATSICQDINEVQPGRKTTHIVLLPPLCHSGAVRFSFPPHEATPWGVQNEKKQNYKRWTRTGPEPVGRVWYIRAQNGKPTFHKCHNHFSAVLIPRHVCSLWLLVASLCLAYVAINHSAAPSTHPFYRWNPFPHKGFFIFLTIFSYKHASGRFEIQFRSALALHNVNAVA